MRSAGWYCPRRRFLSYLTASPLFAQQALPDTVIADPSEALNVLDFELAAKKALPPAHYGYMATGVEDDATLRANREGLQRLYLRPRRLVDIRNVDTKVDVFGTVWDVPIALAPIGNIKAFHPEGELPVARAARTRNMHQILSTNGNTSIADVSETRGAPVWFQLFAASRWDVTEHLVKSAERAKCDVIALTVDTQAGRRTETQERYRLLDKRDCSGCHGKDATSRRKFYLQRKPNFQGLDMEGVLGQDPGLTWDALRRLRKRISCKLLVKGIEVAEDAKLCLDAGVDGVIVSNHGGRAGETGRGTVECLPEVMEAVGGRIPVFIDGGFRRGADVFKALALGAKAVFIGRPYLWGLAAFGQPGVERVIDLMTAELLLTMKQCGTRSISEITKSHVGSRRPAFG
jgi:isopentenyl diphosphate isomerase/L-lactate dehydrogenase-like FMN-dependent dehydrogenase